MATIIGVLVATAAIAHEGWFVRVCPTKTEANRVLFGFLWRPPELQLVLD
jgi:hypothetical protein